MSIYKNINIKTTILSLVLWIGFSIYVEAQTEDLLQEASREIISEIEHENFTLILEQFNDDGVPNLSMSKGFEFIRIGSDLETIMNTLWPKQNFTINPDIKQYKYHIMLQHLDKRRTDDFMEKVLDEFLANNGFRVSLKHEIQIHNCVDVESKEIMSKNRYESERGVVRSTTYRGDELILSGFTLEEVLTEISNRSDNKFSMGYVEPSEYPLEVVINIKNSTTIIESLESYGLRIGKCKKEVEIIYIE